MNTLIHALTATPDKIQITLFTITLMISWNIETIAGISYGYKKWKHAFLNCKFIVSNIPFQFIVGVAFTFLIKWTTANHFGILYLMSHVDSNWLIFLISFILLDFGEYIYHVLMHRIKRFWMFHIVHHTDLYVDTSTSVREHPGENLIRNSFTLLWVFLVGVPFWAFILRLIIQTMSNVFAHLNYQLKPNIDRIVNIIFITPNVHHVHHHFKQPYTDCNYGDVLSIWDRLFGSFRMLEHKDITFGVDTYMEPLKNSKFRSLVKMPFGKYIKSDYNKYS
ncbi:MAG: hypothetical protein NVSMB45_06610 [Ginsengibacter sp.]